jgi:predicted nucleic acid-binding protein
MRSAERLFIGKKFGETIREEELSSMKRRAFVVSILVAAILCLAFFTAAASPWAERERVDRFLLDELYPSDTEDIERNAGNWKKDAEIEASRLGKKDAEIEALRLEIAQLKHKLEDIGAGIVKAVKGPDGLTFVTVSMQRYIYVWTISSNGSVSSAPVILEMHGERGNLE